MLSIANGKLTSRRFAPFMTLLAFLTCLPSPGRAQNAQGTIVGHVEDPSGRAIKGATIQVRNTATGVTNQFTTNGTGDYVVVNLIPGPYQVTAEATGFQTAAANGLQLQVER